MDLQQLQPIRTHDVPMYLQLYQRFRDAIASGKFRPGERVPSVRNLASALNLARGTIEQAYHMLVSEGYFVTRGAAGTVISPQLLSVPVQSNIGITAPPADGPTRPAGKKHDIRPFQLGVPARDAFPSKTWTRLAGHNLRTLDAFSSPPPAGYLPLRQAIAAYVGISRGIACAPEQVFITSGYFGALALICRTLLTPGDTGWYEDPGYLFARQYLEQAGMTLAPVPVNQDGINVEEGRHRAPEARFAVITPTHQSPTGATLSLPGRLALLAWANQQQAWIIEDDYDSEFRYHGRPLPALKSLDQGDRVIYAGTFSKVLYPGLKLAYLVVPAGLIEQFNTAVNYVSGPGAILLQATVADFMRQGYFARHLRKMRLLYAQRHGYLLAAIEKYLADDVYVNPQAGGIHVLAHLKRPCDDNIIARQANLQGLDIQALSNWFMVKPTTGGLLMGFTNFTTEDDAMNAVKTLATILKKQTG